MPEDDGKWGLYVRMAGGMGVCGEYVGKRSINVWITAKSVRIETINVRMTL